MNMIRLTIASLVLILLTGIAAPIELTNAPPPRYCDLYGTVFVEEVAAFADYRVYVEDIESFANMVVYREEVESFADRPGFWFFTDVKAFADFTIAIEPNQGLADFTMAYTDFRSAAGCQ